MKSCLKKYALPYVHGRQERLNLKKGKWYIHAHVWCIVCLIAEKEGVAFSH